MISPIHPISSPLIPHILAPDSARPPGPKTWWPRDEKQQKMGAFVMGGIRIAGFIGLV